MIPQDVMLAAICIGGAIGMAIGVTIQVFFLLTLTRTQKEVAASNQEIAPGTIWLTLLLNLIPIVGSIWGIYLVTRLSNSLRREFEGRGWRTAGEGFGRTAGLLWAWGGLVYVPVSVLQLILELNGDMATASMISILAMPISLGLLVCFILFWVQMAQYGRRLREDRRYRAGSLEDDYDDERPPRRDEFDEDRRDEDYREHREGDRV